MDQASVPGFAPSTGGLHFANSFPHEGLAALSVPAVGNVSIGDAANGLCGGMSYTVCDLFGAGLGPGSETDAPAEGTPQFEYIVRRLVDSFDLPTGPLRYVELMEPFLPDGGGLLGAVVHGRAWTMIEQEWPAVRAEIDAGRLCPLGLIRVLSTDPRELGQNHQVVAYRYELDGTRLSIGVYDPNHPDDDTVELSLDISNPHAPTTVGYSANDEPVYCFFRTEYRAVDPLPWRAAPQVAPAIHAGSRPI